MKRMQIFNSYQTHPWLSRVFDKLKADDLKWSRDFILQNDRLDKGEFEKAVNRMFLDRERPKNWKYISELLICTNSAFQS